MSTKSIIRPRGSDAADRVLICFGFFVVADLFLIRHAWFLENDLRLVAVALPLSQCSLAAVWAAGSHASPYLRFALPPATAIICWYVLAQLLPWGIAEPVSAAWAVSLAVQMLLIISMIRWNPLACDLVAQRGFEPKGKVQSRFTFDLRTLMLWTTVIAVGFGFIQFGRVHWQWTTGVVHWKALAAMSLIGAFHASLAILWLWAFAADSLRRRSTKTVIVVLLIGAFGAVLSSVVKRVTGDPGFNIHSVLVLAIAQSVFLASCLAAARKSITRHKSLTATQ